MKSERDRDGGGLVTGEISHPCIIPHELTILTQASSWLHWEWKRLQETLK